MTSERPEPRRYWAQRHDPSGGRLGLATATRLYRSIVSGMVVGGGLFQEWFGYGCVDGDVTGRAGDDPAAYVFHRTRVPDMWPPSDLWLNWDLPTFLTSVEFLFDHVSAGMTGTFHGFMNCGMHYSTFDRYDGQAVFRGEVNSLLADLDDGYELEPNGEVVRKTTAGFEELLERVVPKAAGSGVIDTVAEATRKFRRGASTAGDRLDAVRDLSGVLELLRPQLKGVLSGKDDDALFEIANKFAVRHMNAAQKIKYDREIWLGWMFYFFLATIHAAVALLNKVAAAKALADERVPWLTIPPEEPVPWLTLPADEKGPG